MTPIFQMQYQVPPLLPPSVSGYSADRASWSCHLSRRVGHPVRPRTDLAIGHARQQGARYIVLSWATLALTVLVLAFGAAR